jgi:hypothetical protein
MWYNISALQGKEGAGDQITSLENKMTRQEIQDAQEYVKAFAEEKMNMKKALPKKR